MNGDDIEGVGVLGKGKVFVEADSGGVMLTGGEIGVKVSEDGGADGKGRGLGKGRAGRGNEGL